MQTFAEFMAESFDSNAKLLWDYPRRSHATATFNVDRIKAIVSFEQRDTNGPWYVVFEVDRGDSTAAVHSSFEIFNGVFQAVEEFIEVREPETVVFATKRDKLAGIYQTYLRKESAALEKLGYELEGPHRVDPFMEFVLKRTKPSDWKA
ncbi:MAG: hypothetical protein ACLQU1_20885 [Bryobacteraceae bacterium]